MFDVQCSKFSPPIRVHSWFQPTTFDVPKSKIKSKSNPNEQPPTTLSADLTQGLVSGDAGSGGKVEGAQLGIGLWDGDAVALKFLV